MPGIAAVAVETIRERPKTDDEKSGVKYSQCSFDAHCRDAFLW